MVFDKYIVEFPNDMKFKVYDNDFCSGIIFYDSTGQYDLVHNKIDWNRLIINYTDGSWRDLPFHQGTWHFLPASITIQEYHAYK